MPVAPTRRDVVALAWPIVLANAAVPLLGLADTAVIGNTGSVADLGAIGLGAVIFSFVFWGFGFLRMGTTGFVAQAAGRADSAEVRATAIRGLLLAGALGALLLLLQQPIGWLSLRLLDAPAAVEPLTARYVAIRIWAAPASLGLFVVLGVLIGLGRTRHVLLLQLVLNGLNIALDVLFAGVMGWGVAGIAAGTALAEWLTVLAALLLLARVLREERTDTEPWWTGARLRDRARARAMLSANADIMVRTLFLLLGFGWFANRGARFGDVVLAANHVLLQLVSLSAYLLDGYAHASEILVGRAVGRADRGGFDHAIRRSTELGGSERARAVAAHAGAGPGDHAPAHEPRAGARRRRRVPAVHRGLHRASRSRRSSWTASSSGPRPRAPCATRACSPASGSSPRRWRSCLSPATSGCGWRSFCSWCSGRSRSAYDCRRSAPAEAVGAPQVAAHGIP